MTYFVSIFKDAYSRDLIGYTYSLANLASFLTWATIIVAPFVVAFASGDLWAKGDAYMEQPELTFTGKYYAQLMFLHGGCEAQFAYSSVKPVRDNIDPDWLLPAPVVQTTPVTRKDTAVSSRFIIQEESKPDQYNITMRFLKPGLPEQGTQQRERCFPDGGEAQWSLASANLILAFDYKLSDIINLKMEGLAVVDIQTMTSGRLNAGKLMAEGPLRLRQPNLLKVLPGGKVHETYNDRYFDRLETMNVRDFLLNYKTNRNETTFYDFTKTVYYGPEGAQDYIDIELIVSAPEQSVYYIPQFWQVLKNAWVKYFAWWFVFYWLLYRGFLNFVVTGGVFDTVEVAEVDLSEFRNSY